MSKNHTLFGLAKNLFGKGQEEVEKGGGGGGA